MGQCDQNGCTTIVTDSDITSSVSVAMMSNFTVVNVAVTSTEGFDRYNLSLGDAQNKLVAQVAAANPNTIVVVRCPGAILMPWIDAVKAVVVQFLPGEQAGNALASVLFGDVDPSGRLPVSFPKTDEQTWLTTPTQYPGVPGVWAKGQNGNGAISDCFSTDVFQLMFD